VTSYGQLLVRRHGERLDGEAREFLDFIVDGGQRAQALIGDLLGLARVSSQARPFEPVALAPLLEQALRGLRLAMEESGAVVTHDEPLPVVSGDRRQLMQLLHNLLANALKFRTGEPPRVHVGARCDDGQWRISVTDNGIGIDAQFHGRVFGMFQRLHLRSAYGGTGIGLAICKKVVERHGGHIGVESAPGRGSTFWFTLPDGSNAARQAAPATAEPVLLP
jgi:signal transduction histidine kinase